MISGLDPHRGGRDRLRLSVWSNSEVQESLPPRRESSMWFVAIEPPGLQAELENERGKAGTHVRETALL